MAMQFLADASIRSTADYVARCKSEIVKRCSEATDDDEKTALTFVLFNWHFFENGFESDQKVYKA